MEERLQEFRRRISASKGPFDENENQDQNNPAYLRGENIFKTFLCIICYNKMLLFRVFV